MAWQQDEMDDLAQELGIIDDEDMAGTSQAERMEKIAEALGMADYNSDSNAQTEELQNRLYARKEKVDKEKDSNNRKKSGYRKTIGNIWDNIKGAFRGEAKHIFILKFKLIVFVVIAVLVFIALIVEGDAIETSNTTSNKIHDVLIQSKEDPTETYKNTGSLMMATDGELKEITNNILEEMDRTHKSYVDDLKIVYSGKKPNTVANKIAHITTNFNADETDIVEVVDNDIEILPEQSSLTQERSILEHILRTEKYNFNNIIWRSFVKDENNKLKQEEMSFQVDSKTNLKYPAQDENDTDKLSHDLSFFVTKTRSYLQSWYIPFDLMIGTIDQTTDNLNTKFAYELLASAYHEVVLDRYKIETLTRQTNYLVYDKTITTTTVTRNCATYKVGTRTVLAKAEGSACKKGEQYCEDGVLTKNIFKQQDITRQYCTDSKAETKVIEEDIRESVSKTENITYRWNYVVSAAKMFDNVISDTYEFTPYYKYSTANYNSFINKSGSYSNMSVESFKNSEETNSKADGFSHTASAYYATDSEDVIKEDWNNAYYVSAIPSGATRISGVTSKVVSKVVVTEKDGQSYFDNYVWNDTLDVEEMKSGIYNMDSLKDVTGDDLTDDDTKYYEYLYRNQELNLVDLMNSNKDIYSEYLTPEEMNTETENIGIFKDRLDLAYSVLKDDLKELVKKYSSNSIKYGESLGVDTSSFTILGGISFGDVENIAAGNMEGKNVAYPISSSALSNSYLQVLSKFGNSYGYQGHTGIDISYAYSAADKSMCSDYSNSVCPYIKGPEIYTMMDGVIKEVGYSAYNKYYKEGEYVGNSTDGNLKISDTSGWGTYVKIQNVDGSYVIYSHLFPNKDFYKQMSEKVGENVSAGTFIGYMGNTGSSSGLHLHIEFSSSMSSLGGKTANSSTTYIYLMKIIDAMGINPPKV